MQGKPPVCLKRFAFAMEAFSKAELIDLIHEMTSDRFGAGSRAEAHVRFVAGYAWKSQAKRNARMPSLKRRLAKFDAAAEIRPVVVAFVARRLGIDMNADNA